MSIAVVNSGGANISSVLHALGRLGAESRFTHDADVIMAADRVILPGVGAAGNAMDVLRRHGLVDVIRGLTQPVLGICLGLQIMCTHSEEADTECLGIFPNTVRLFEGEEKVPQIGWNTVQHTDCSLFKGVPESSYMYYVHSYFADISPYSVARTTYMTEFSAAIVRDNFYAVQFHPEKSAAAGAQLLSNFLQI